MIDLADVAALCAGLSGIDVVLHIAGSLSLSKTISGNIGDADRRGSGLKRSKAIWPAVGSVDGSGIIACIVKSRERFMGIGQVLTMPIFFGSNAIYPLTLMPTWLKAISTLNPLSYEVDGLRALMLQGGVSSFGLGRDIAALLTAVFVVAVISMRMYPRMTE